MNNHEAARRVVFTKTCTRVRSGGQSGYSLNVGPRELTRGRQMASSRHLESPIYTSATSLSPLCSSIHTARFSESLSVHVRITAYRISCSHTNGRGVICVSLLNSVSCAYFVADMMSSAYKNCVIVFWFTLGFFFANLCFHVPEFALVANLYMLFFRNWLKGEKHSNGARIYAKSFHIYLDQSVGISPFSLFHNLASSCSKAHRIYTRVTRFDVFFFIFGKRIYIYIYSFGALFKRLL